MLPMNVLQFSELPTFDALPASETLLPEDADALEGVFADVLQHRIDIDLELPSDDGGILPHPGNNLPLLPPQPVQSAELLPVTASIFKDFFDTNPQEPVAGWVRDYNEGSTIHGPHRSVALIETHDPKLAADVKSVLPAIGADVPKSAPPALPTALPATLPVPPLLTPQPDSAQLRRAVANVAVRNPAELALPRDIGEKAKALPSEFEGLTEQRDTAIPRIVNIRGPENMAPKPATRRVVDAGIPLGDTDDVDLGLPPLRVDPKIAGDDVAMKLGRDDMQPVPRPLVTNTSQPGSFSVETIPSADAAVRVGVAETTAIAPKQTLASPSAQTIVYSIGLPVQESGWDKAMSERVMMMANGKLQNAEIRLTPAELGPLRVQVAIDEGTANVTFQAQHALTREAIELAMPRLREMLAEQGLLLGETNVSDDGVQHGGREDAERAQSDSRHVADEGNLEELSERSVHTRVDDSLVDTFA
ncbi:MAG: flagellar hook-length control protein FliK [Gammaproteobacteria bacterium]|nr:flagellar hook-length control protein FliK [Gammaproteobacteria bacterium]